MVSRGGRELLELEEAQKPSSRVAGAHTSEAIVFM